MATPATTAAAYRSALGSVVKATAAVGTIFDVTSDSLSMLGNFVREHSDRQAVSNATDREIWLEQLERDSAVRLAEINITAEDFCNKSPKHNEYYTLAAARIDNIIKAYRPSNKTEPSE